MSEYEQDDMKHFLAHFISTNLTSHDFAHMYFLAANQVSALKKADTAYYLKILGSIDLVKASSKLHDYRKSSVSFPKFLNYHLF